jgi:P-type Ca2+ transporter type 2C
MAMLPAAVAASVGTDWKSPGSLSDPADSDPSKSSTALWDGNLQVHPDTKPDDPIFSLLGVKPNNRNPEP